ncbi:hypothetical protein [Altericroceibacterium endophyticum]|uniref:Uncharacterized protein n=1 Tax=Altericroceibacterium endophyticum TaxID=1808508 RepID=A0A6I4T514_9SPHN|nr:hypothetical protein [Altericroceibacterium endophyticum]MXO65957.1 hypothetical protein [Altericroceibacterium endophyticum]
MKLSDKKTDNNKPKNKPRNFARNVPRNLKRLAKTVIKYRPISRRGLLNVRDWLFAEIWGENLSSEKRQAQLFSFEPWDKLKMAVMDSRDLPLPDNIVPDSAAGLLELCKKLLDRSDDGYLRTHFVTGWAGVEHGFEDAELRAFCEQLWQTSANDPDFYRLVVRGDHGSATAYLTKHRIPVGLTAESAIRLIYRMELIWCAHDAQASAGRAARSMKGAFSWLHSNVEGERMCAGTPIAIWRPVYQMLTENTDRYRTNEEARGGKAEAKPTRHDDVKNIKAVVEPTLQREMLRDISRKDRDHLLADVRDLAESQDDIFWNEIRKDKTSEEVANLQMSQIWYRGLTPLQVISLAVVRLIQMEATLEKRIASMYRHTGSTDAFYPPVLAFSQSELPENWRKRAVQLVDDLRRTILNDCDHGSRNEEVREGAGVTSHSNDYLDEALRFLEEANQEPLPNAPSLPLTGKRRTASLLDVAAETRMAR